jgi:hypothetical protein
MNWRTREMCAMRCFSAKSFAGSKVRRFSASSAARSGFVSGAGAVVAGAADLFACSVIVPPKVRSDRSAACYSPRSLVR